ncbi:OLC1v1009980C2 [Oldenlandia corymbosa var. corymbosa]|uniref:OLC1v1009980C2 n=1 Tax=Oldenlandia corymbosa var. corymbosa TaxID=529605 RepID=A0AAV1DSV8_OLDCO|nr:OLC1v1009980C2 [Oldenlandia corymbosa var. corymbosa]
MEVGAAPGSLRLIQLRIGRRISNPSPSFYPKVRCNLKGAGSNGVEPISQNLRMFILGMGFVGQYFAADLKQKGWVVSGTCTSTAMKMKLEQMGYDAYVFDANEPQVEVLDIMKYHTHLLISIPPVPDIGDPLLQHKELLKSRLRDGNLQWLSYLSSTRVYGDSGGAWVDEDHPIMPTSELARSRLAAEEGWSRLGQDLEIAVQIFRLGGIYGPGRSAIDTIIKKEPLSPSQRKRSSRRYTSRIHVSDICQALNASIEKPSNRRIYNIVDDDPAPRAEVFKFAQNLVKSKWQDHGREFTFPQVPETLPSEGVSTEEKRVNNARMKLELGVKLRYPTYKSGLQDITDQMSDPFVS